jgi:hypothetical protein
MAWYLRLELPDDLVELGLLILELEVPILEYALPAA